MQGFVIIFLMSIWISSHAENIQDRIHSRDIFGIATDFLRSQKDILLSLEDYEGEKLQVKAIMKAVKLQEEDESSCNVCKTFFGAVKGLSAVFEWEEVRDAVVDICHRIFNSSDVYVRHDVLCPGTVDLQGPHVYEISRARHRKSAEEICTFLNSCILPKPQKQESSYREQTRKEFLQYQGHSQTLSERKKSALKIVQLTDIHIEPDYAEGSSTDCGLYVCCDLQYGVGDAGRYGDYKCNIPGRTVNLFLQKAASFQPEAILYSGDTPPNTLWDETYHSQLHCSGLLVEAMQRHLSNFRVLPNIGNHEMYPTNLYSVSHLETYTVPMNAEFVEMWSGLANFSVTSEETMRKGGYYTELILPKLRLISFNTNYWYTMNFYNVLNNDSPEIEEMFTFMKDTLQSAKDNDEKVILQGHHPPGIADTIVQYSREFELLVEEYSDVITLYVAGHLHSDQFRVHSNATGEAVSVMFAAPSVSSSINKNPSMRVFYLHPITHELIDFEQYGFDLGELQGTEVPNITLMYSAVQDYGLEDMSPLSWRNVIDRFETDEDLFQVYYRNLNTGFPVAECNYNCRWRYICESQFYSYDDIIECQKNIPVSPTKMPSTTSVFGSGNGLANRGVYLLMSFCLVWKLLMN